MTVVTVVSSLTTLRASGNVELGEQDVDALTVGDVKRLVEKRTMVPAEKQKLWWSGYILDNDSLPISRACVGVNESEAIPNNIESLVIFMTLEERKDKEDEEDQSLSLSFRRRIRSNSFDIEKLRSELRQKKETLVTTCVVL